MPETIMYVGDQPIYLCRTDICERPGCGKSMIVKRTGRKRFCSQRCAGLNTQKPREENTAYMWLHRLERKTLAELMKPSVQKRIADIKNRWPRLAEKIKRIEDATKTHQLKPLLSDMRGQR